MNKTYIQFIFTSLILLLSLGACTLPGQTSPALPATNPGAVETSIASTAQAALEQTEQVGLVTPTSTVAPVETNTPVPQASLYGTSLISREDQSAEFIDNKAGVKLTIPAGWLPVRPNESEYYNAFALDVVLQHPEISDRLTRIQSSDSNFFRLEAIDVRDGHIQNGILTIFNVIFEEGDTRTLEEWADAEKNRDHILADFKFLSSNFSQTANNTRILVIEQSWTSGQTDTIYYKGVFFSLPTGTIVLDFYSDNNFKDTVLPDFEQVVNSLVQID